MICTDWELGQSYRHWRRKYGDQWEAPFRERYEAEMIENTTLTFMSVIFISDRMLGLSWGSFTRLIKG